jgi:hypothetical protein
MLRFPFSFFVVIATQCALQTAIGVMPKEHKAQKANDTLSAF